MNSLKDLISKFEEGVPNIEVRRFINYVLLKGGGGWKCRTCKRSNNTFGDGYFCTMCRKPHIKWTKKQLQEAHNQGDFTSDTEPNSSSADDTK